MLGHRTVETTQIYTDADFSLSARIALADA